MRAALNPSTRAVECAAAMLGPTGVSGRHFRKSIRVTKTYDHGDVNVHHVDVDVEQQTLCWAEEGGDSLRRTLRRSDAILPSGEHTSQIVCARDKYASGIARRQGRLFGGWKAPTVGREDHRRRGGETQVILCDVGPDLEPKQHD